MRGPGYWLNPSTDKLVNVGTTHDEWIRNRDNARSIGLPDFVSDNIAACNPRQVDEIRIYALMAGLVRIRDYGKSISVQFWCERHRVRNVLWSTALALKGEAGVHPDTHVSIDNLNLNDSVRLTLQELIDKLKEDVPILKEEEERQDIPMNSPAVIAARLKFSEFVKQKEQSDKKE